MELLIFVISLIGLFAVVERICKCCETCSMHKAMAELKKFDDISKENEDDLK